MVHLLLTSSCRPHRKEPTHGRRKGIEGTIVQSCNVSADDGLPAAENELASGNGSDIADGLQPAADYAAGECSGQYAPVVYADEFEQSLFTSNAAQTAQNQYYNQAIAPQLQSAALHKFMGGNMGDSSSTFGSTMLGSLAAQGANQAFFSGQQYYDDQLNNMLNERNNYFGTSVQLPVTQNNLSANMQNSTNQINANQLAGLNQFDLGAGQQIGGLMQNQLGATNAYNAQRSQSMGNLLGGGIGSLFGLNSMFGNPIGQFGSGLGQWMFG